MPVNCELVEKRFSRVGPHRPQGDPRTTGGLVLWLTRWGTRMVLHPWSTIGTSSVGETIFTGHFGIERCWRHVGGSREAEDVPFGSFTPHMLLDGFAMAMV